MNSFWKNAAAHPERLGLVEADGTEHTAGEVLAACNQVVHGLRALGLSKGDTIATMLPNGAAMAELALGCAQAGIYITPVNYHLVAPEVRFIVEDSGSRVFVVHERYIDVARAALEGGALPADNVFVVGEAEGFRSYDELKRGQPSGTPEDRAGGFAMTYTSGTTGRPRGVRRPMMDVDADVLANSFSMFLQLFGIRGEGVHLVVAPLYHTAVLNFCLYSFHLGHALVLMDKWTPEGCLECIDRYRVTHSHMVPTMLVRMLALPEEERLRYDLSSLEHLIHSAAPCPIEVKWKILEWFGDVVYEYYAASEGGGTLATPQQWREKPGTVGKAWPISTIRILDDDKQMLAAGEVGTVWIRMGDHRFEYHGDDDKTEQAWSEGFFTVGDAGYMDEDEFLFLCDRKADMIISGGVNVYPAEIEAQLICHPLVADCAVFGIPDEDWGEQVKAVVEPRDGVVVDDELTAALLAHCAERLAKYKCPRTVDFVAELPRDPNGKLYKRKLRDPYWEGRERAI